MGSAALTRFLRLLEEGKDSALLRFSIGNEYLKEGATDNAALHLRQAVMLDESYSAAWKLLGHALAQCGNHEQALAAYERGIEVAQTKGDQQAAREMQVFAKRLRSRQT